ncbi:hypothetical protein LTR70_005272 [Exophiala xenobiotica]|uniref:Major facilitator superfamily (MFS) profile domain-containing protein n=1 Tax=Lithohypha guttulata TaxID=1690604 RepID=A0ABR0KAX6_9EURO|nr:hypothetical protein LTR24_004924 [Lithohypha guttulata]KAK5318837.1 hypothetical protein LTR70_005272 [Exophiala xenobiotica]
MGLDANEPHSEQSTLQDQAIAHIDESPPESSSDRALHTADNEKNDVETPSQESQKPAGGLPPPPNGGLTAWLHVLGGFSLFFNTWGILNTFGIYQTYYESGALFTESSSNISWIGAIQAYSVLLVGFLSGPIYDRGYFRSLLAIGSFGVVFGHMMLSISDKFWQILLAQGFCVGIGAGCLFVPCVAILPSYWSTKLGLAVGLAAAGSSLGGVIYPIVFYKLIDQVGFGWSTRVIGFIALVTLLVPNFVMKMRFKPPKARALIDWSAFTDGPYVLAVMGAMIGFIGLYVMFFFISYYAQEAGITSAAMSFYIVPIFNAGSTFGRVLPNALSDKTGPVNLIAPGALIVGALQFAMIGVESEAALIVVAVLFGFFSGVFIALPPVLFVALTKDKTKIGTRIGMGFGFLGFGVLAGGPGGGSLLGGGSGTYHWTSLWVYAGVSGIVSSVLFIILRIRKAGSKLTVKV